MAGESQRNYVHSVASGRPGDAPRINLTFRVVQKKSSSQKQPDVMREDREVPTVAAPELALIPSPEFTKNGRVSNVCKTKHHEDQEQCVMSCMLWWAIGGVGGSSLLVFLWWLCDGISMPDRMTMLPALRSAIHFPLGLLLGRSHGSRMRLIALVWVFVSVAMLHPASAHGNNTGYRVGDTVSLEHYNIENAIYELDGFREPRLVMEADMPISAEHY